MPFVRRRQPLIERAFGVPILSRKTIRGRDKGHDTSDFDVARSNRVFEMGVPLGRSE